jgi:hypothetical protein
LQKRVPQTPPKKLCLYVVVGAESPTTTYQLYERNNPMKKFGLLVVIMSLAIVLACSISYAAPACCDPTQGSLVKSPATVADVGSGGIPGVVTTKSAPRASQPASVIPQVPYGLPTQAKRPVAPAPVQLSSFYQPVGPVAARAGGGCCASASGFSAARVQAAVQGCGGACPSCLSGGNVSGQQARPLVQPSVPECCSGKGTNPAPAAQAKSKSGGYVPEKPVVTGIKTVPRVPAGLTANSSFNRSQSPRFATLW